MIIPASFAFIFVFENSYGVNFADDWIRAADLFCQNRLSHNTTRSSPAAIGYNGNFRRDIFQPKSFECKAAKMKCNVMWRPPLLLYLAWKRKLCNIWHFSNCDNRRQRKKAFRSDDISSEDSWSNDNSDTWKTDSGSWWLKGSFCSWYVTFIRGWLCQVTQILLDFNSLVSNHCCNTYLPYVQDEQVEGHCNETLLQKQVIKLHKNCFVSSST